MPLCPVPQHTYAEASPDRSAAEVGLEGGAPSMQSVKGADAPGEGRATMGSMTGWQALADQVMRRVRWAAEPPSVTPKRACSSSIHTPNSHIVLALLCP